MRDFRTIRKFEIEWKNAKKEQEEAKANLKNMLPGGTPQGGIGGGGLNLEELVDQLAEQS